MSNLKKAFEANAKLGLKPMSEIKKRAKMADGGLIAKRADMIEQMAGAPAITATPSPAPLPAPAPVAPPAPAPAPMSPEEIALRQKYGMATPGAPKPGMFDTIKKKIGFKDGGEPDGDEVSLRQALRAGKSGKPGYVKGPGGPTDDKVPVTTPNGHDIDASNGEYVLPADTVEAMGGKEALDKIVLATHDFVDKGREQEMHQEASLRRGFADGGPLVTRPNWIPGGQPSIDPNVIEGTATRMDGSSRNPNVSRGQPSAEARAYVQGNGMAPGAPVFKPGETPVGGTTPVEAVKQPSVLRRGLNAVGRFSGPAAGALAAVPEVLNTVDVANDAKSSRLDVANQAASGLGRWGAASAGAAAGAASTGPFAPIGALVGGAAGYFLGDKAIKYGREYLPRVFGAPGVDPADPIERIRPPAKLSVAVQPPANNAIRTSVMDGSSGVEPVAAPVQEQPSLRRPINDMERQRLYAIYGDPSRYDPANIAAEDARIHAKYSIDKPQRPFGDTAPGSFDDLMNLKAEQKQRLQAMDLASRDAVSLRTAMTAMRGQDMTARTAREAAFREQFNKDRQYGLDVFKTNNEAANKAADNVRADSAARDSAQKALTERISSMIPPTYDKDGKAMPDTQTAARHIAGMNAMLGERIAATKAYLSKNPNDAQAKAWLAKAEKDGVHALDESDVRRFVAGTQAAEVAQANHSAWNPFGGTAVVSDAPITSLRRRPGIVFDDYVSNRGDVIPARAIDREGGLLGAFGKTNRNYDIIKGQ